MNVRLRPIADIDGLSTKEADLNRKSEEGGCRIESGMTVVDLRYASTRSRRRLIREMSAFTCAISPEPRDFELVGGEMLLDRSETQPDAELLALHLAEIGVNPLEKFVGVVCNLAHPLRVPQKWKKSRNVANRFGTSIAWRGCLGALGYWPLEYSRSIA